MGNIVPLLNFDTHLSRSKLDKQIKIHFWRVLWNISIGLPFYTISYNLDMIFCHQYYWIHFWVSKCIILIYFLSIKTVSKVNQNKVNNNFDWRKIVYQSSSRVHSVILKNGDSKWTKIDNKIPNNDNFNKNYYIYN